MSKEYNGPFLVTTTEDGDRDLAREVTSVNTLRETIEEVITEDLSKVHTIEVWIKLPVSVTKSIVINGLKELGIED